MNQIAFLRGINVSGKNKIPMADLKSVCEDLGWQSVTTYLQTGNVIFSAKGGGSKHAKELAAAIHSQMGLDIPVTVRTATEFMRLLSDSPLAEQAAISPGKVILYLTQEKVSPKALDYLNERAVASETVFVDDCALWIYFPNGVGKSKLTPSVIDRAAGSFATGRNWNTCSKIQAICTKE